MRTWTYGEGLDLINGEFDLTNETFIGDDEMVGFFNHAVQKAAADIYKLGVEDEYFQNEAALPMVVGQSDIALPTDIYANKIRGLIYVNGYEIYEVTRSRRRKKFLKEAKIRKFAPDARYQYRLKNTGIATGTTITLIPAARDTTSAFLTAYYIREVSFIPLVSAGSLSASRATKIDLPECMEYIFAEVKWRVAKKIPHPDLDSYKNDRDEMRALMIETLTGQTDDDNTEVEPDLTHYQESS